MESQWKHGDLGCIPSHWWAAECLSFLVITVWSDVCIVDWKSVIYLQLKNVPQWRGKFRSSIYVNSVRHFWTLGTSPVRQNSSLCVIKLSKIFQHKISQSFGFLNLSEDGMGILFWCAIHHKYITYLIQYYQTCERIIYSVSSHIQNP